MRLLDIIKGHLSIIALASSGVNPYKSIKADQQRFNTLILLIPIRGSFNINDLYMYDNNI